MEVYFPCLFIKLWQTYSQTYQLTNEQTDKQNAHKIAHTQKRCHSKQIFELYQSQKLPASSYNSSSTNLSNNFETTATVNGQDQRLHNQPEKNAKEIIIIKMIKQGSQNL